MISSCVDPMQETALCAKQVIVQIMKFISDPCMQELCRAVFKGVGGGGAVADPGFGKGDFMRMCTVATTPPYDVHAH